MYLKLIYISGERNHRFLEEEIKTGVNTIHKLGGDLNSFNEISITSIFMRESDSSQDREVSVFESSYDWWNNSNYLQENHNFDTSEKEEIHINDFYKLADYLHTFCDDNLHCGGGSVYIFWCVENYVPSPSELVEFYGSLERLKKWYSAHIYVITKYRTAIEEWISFLPIQIVNSSEQVITSILETVWRGSLAFSIKGKAALNIFPEVTLQCQNKNSDLFVLNGIKKTSGPLHVLPVAEVFSEVDLDSVPPAFIQKGSLCRLFPSSDLLEEERKEMTDVLSRLSSANGVGRLLRIRYSSKLPLAKGLQSASSETWKQMIAEGNFAVSPEWVFEGCHDVIVFLMLPTRTKKDWVDCIALQDPSKYNEEVSRLVLQEQLKTPVVDESSKMKILSLLQETSEWSDLETNIFSYLLENLPNLVKRKLEEKSENGLVDIKKEIQYSFNCSTNRHILAFLQPSSLVHIRSPNCSLVSETSVSKEFWDEYKALEEHENAKKSSILRCTSGDFLCGLSPPAPLRKENGMDASQLLKSYCESYKKENYNIRRLREGRRIATFGRLRDMSWREALDAKHHGIYYNSGKQREKCELMCSRLREQMIRCETSTTCTHFRKQEVSVGSQAERKNKRLCDPESQSILSLSRVKKRRSDSDSCSVTSSVRNHRFDSHNTPQTRASSKRLEPPVRRSPRRHKNEQRKELKPSDLLSKRTSLQTETKKSPLKQKKNPKPADLNERHKQKLRNVVLSSLESEGITMKDKLFKLCFQKLFHVCKPFALDVVGEGATTRSFEKIARSHVKQVVHFERRKKR